jgi:hypothetical protein
LASKYLDFGLGSPEGLTDMKDVAHDIRTLAASVMSQAA